MSELLDSALMYADMGLSVLPLNGKIPVFPNWPELATRDKTLIARWWKQNPSANIGVATGKKSDCFVVDIDPRHGGKETWDYELMNHAGIPNTWQDMTGGGGLHVFFRYPNFPVKNAAGILPGIDIRGDGGQVVVPPSIHPDTHRRYEWDGLKDIQKQDLAQAPAWILELVAPQPGSGTTAKPSELALKIPHGTQHHTLLSLAGMMRRLGLTEDEIFPTLMAVNEKRCEKPGPEKNIRIMAKSVMRYKPGDADLYTMATKLWRLTRRAEAIQQTLMDDMKPVDAWALLKKPAEEASMVIDGCLHKGCTILAGPPKSGKSWLTLGMGISVATGGKFIGSIDVLRPGRVGYWALEESQRRTRDRLGMLIESPDIALQNLEFLYAIRPMTEGGLEDLSVYCEKYHPDLIVIDTLMAFVTGARSSRRDVFRDDYREIKALSGLAGRFALALLVVHHTNKIGGDIIGSVAGTHGVTAAADCIWRMQKQPERRAMLEMTGREIENQAFLLELDLKSPVGWQIVEQGDDVVLSGVKQIVLEVLRESGPKTPKQISVEIGQNPVTARQILRRMARAGLLVTSERGFYSIPQANNNKTDKRYGDKGDE